MPWVPINAFTTMKTPHCSRTRHICLLSLCACRIQIIFFFTTPSASVFIFSYFIFILVLPFSQLNMHLIRVVLPFFQLVLNSPFHINLSFLNVLDPCKCHGSYPIYGEGYQISLILQLNCVITIALYSQSSVSFSDQSLPSAPDTPFRIFCLIPLGVDEFKQTEHGFSVVLTWRILPQFFLNKWWPFI